MAKNKVEDLRDHLFETIELLKDPDSKMDVQRARAISDLAGRVIDSAKVEVDHLKVTGQTEATDFLPPAGGRKALPSARRES